MTAALLMVLWVAFYWGSNHSREAIPPSHGSNGSSYQEYMSTHQRALDAQLRVFMVKYDCTTPETWQRDHPKDLPKLMVLKKDKTWDLMVVNWNYPAPPGFWTLLLCEGSHA